MSAVAATPLADRESVRTGRHRGVGRATSPTTGYASLDRSHRRRILKALLLGRPIEPADEPFARDKATSVSSRLPHGLLMGVVFGVFCGTSVESLFPLSPGTTALLVVGVLCVLTYVLCVAGGLRIWLWLRKRS